MDEAEMQAKLLDTGQTRMGDLFIKFQDLWGGTQINTSRIEANRRIG